LQTFTVIAEVERPELEPNAETESAEVTVADIVSPEESISTSAVNENVKNLSLSELEQVLPKLPPKQPQVPPRLAASRSRPACSQSFSAAPPPRPPRAVHRAQSSMTPAQPPVPPRAPRTMTAVHNPSTLFSLQQPAALSSSSVINPHPTSLFSHAPPGSDAGALGSTLNYVYFTEDAVQPQSEVIKGRKYKQPPDVNLFGSTQASVGKKLADSGLGTVSALSYGDEVNSAGSYVRLDMSSARAAPIDTATSHDYCYPSIDTVVPPPPTSICRIEPQHSPPPLPTKSHRVGWWDCHGRKRRSRCSQLRATWTQRAATYGTEPSVIASRVSLNNSQSSSLNARRPSAAWRSTLLCFVRTCMHPCRWRRRCRPRRGALPARCHISAT